MPYTEVMLLTAQPQHKKWRKLPNDSRPLPTIQPRGRLSTYVPGLELRQATTAWLAGPPKSEVPMAALNSGQFNCFKTVGVPSVSRSSLIAGARSTAGPFRSSPTVKFESTLRISVHCLRAR
jgi:hypothetical protein